MMNIYEIAEKAGVSRSTVSRVINDDPRVSDATRRRVRQVIIREDYHPSRSARLMASQRSGVIGVSGLSGPRPEPNDIYRLHAIVAALLARGLQPRILDLSNDEAPDLGSLEGAIVCGDAPSLLGKLSETGVPIVNAGPFSEHVPYHVGTDYFRGGEMAARHLWECGARRFAFVSSAQGATVSSGAKMKYRGASCFLEELCLDLSTNLSPEEERDDGLAVWRQLVQEGPTPDGVIANNEAMGMGILMGLHESGLIPGRDVKVICYDDFHIARHAGLSAIDQQYSELGRAAAEMLAELLDGKRETPRQVVLSPRLIVRASTGGEA